MEKITKTGNMFKIYKQYENGGKERMIRILDMIWLSTTEELKGEII